VKTGFGWIETGGKRYLHDIVIHTDGSITKRKKKLSKTLKEEYGHTPLSGEELVDLLREKPAVVYIGTGQYGSLPLTPDVAGLLAPFVAVVKPTPEILPLLKQDTARFVAVLHVTC
jgi:hypothetical protein